MFTVYILKDEHGKLYKGVTNDLQRRMREHQSGYTKTTSRMNNLDVVYTETYPTFEEARQREKYLKSAAGRRYVKFTLHIRP